MNRRPFDDVRAALEPGDSAHAPVRLDFDRAARTGIPEIIYGPNKTPSEIANSLERLADAQGHALATRCSGAQLAQVQEMVRSDLHVDADELAGCIRVTVPGLDIEPTRGPVGVITAGSSDRRVATEAMIVLRELGCVSNVVNDVGVAGLHRLVRPLERLIDDGARVLIVVAGMDGALPSVVAGLVRVPVIAVPTSTGYGFGGDGVGALMTMLQSCAPGVVVVNIDNGVGAACAASLIVGTTSRPIP